MFYRLLLINAITLSLSACFWDDYEQRQALTASTPIVNENETLPDSGLVANGNLEDSETEATGWASYANAGSATFALSSAQYYTGAHAFKVSVTEVGADEGDIGAGPVNVPVEEDFTYYFSAWILGTNGATANVVAHPSGDPSTILASQQIDVTSTWQRVTFQFDGPLGVTAVDLQALLSNELNLGADIYLDHFSLKGVKPAGSVVEIPIEEGLAGWSPDQSPTTLEYDGNLGLLLTPDWSANDQVAIYELATPMDVTGLTINYVVNIPQEYIDAGISIQPYVQEVGGMYAGDWSGYVDVSNLTEGVNIIPYTPANPPQMIQRIGIQVKGEGRSIDPTSAISIQRIYYKGAEEEAGSDVPLDTGWTASNGDPVYDSAGVSYSPMAASDQLSYILAGPDDLEGANIVFSITVDQAFIDSGSNLQPFAQQQFGDYTGKWSCWINNADLSTSGSQHTCTLDESGAPFNLGADQSLKIAIQVPDGSTPAGTVTITDVQIEYPSLPVDSGWRTSSGAEPTYDGGVMYSPAANEQLVTDVIGPNNFEGATFEFTIEASEEFIASGTNLQPFAQAKVGADWPGEWGCWINNADLSAAGGSYNCTLQAAEFNLQDGEEMQIGVIANGSPAGTIKITNVRIHFAD